LPAHRGKDDSVHLGEFPPGRDWLSGRGAGFVERMDRLMAVREKVLKELEKAREAKLIGNSLEACVTLRAPAAEARFLEENRADLPSLFIVSAVAVETGPAETLEITVGRAAGGKCERCWNFSDDVGKSPTRPTFCARCERAVEGGRP